MIETSCDLIIFFCIITFSVRRWGISLNYRLNLHALFQTMWLIKIDGMHTHIRPYGRDVSDCSMGSLTMYMLVYIKSDVLNCFKNTFAFPIISELWGGSVSWYPSSWKLRSSISSIVPSPGHQQPCHWPTSPGIFWPQRQKENPFTIGSPKRYNDILLFADRMSAHGIGITALCAGQAWWHA